MLDFACPSADPAAFGAEACLRCRASDRADRRACAAARLIAAGYDLARPSINPTTAIPASAGTRAPGKD